MSTLATPMPQFTPEQIQAILAEAAALKAANAELEQRVAETNNIKIKVGDTGVISVNLGGQYPTSLYKSAWLRLFEQTNIDRIKAFITANESEIDAKAAASLEAKKAARAAKKAS